MNTFLKMNRRTCAIVATLLFVWSTPTFAGLWFSVPPVEKSVIEMGSYSESALNPNDIRVMVWNIYKGKKDSWESDYSYLSHDRDFILLQEVVNSDKVKKHFEIEATHGLKLATSFISKRSGTRTGVAIGSRSSPTKFGFRRSKKKELIGRTPKVMAFAEYDLSRESEKLLVINIHSLNSVTAKTHFTELKTSRKLIDSHVGPVIFAGDFNTWTKKKTKSMRSYLRSLGFSEVVFPNGDDRMKAPITNRVLDFIFVRGLSYKDAQVWDDLDGSDHKALYVTLSASK